MGGWDWLGFGVVLGWVMTLSVIMLALWRDVAEDYRAFRRSGWPECRVGAVTAGAMSVITLALLVLTLWSFWADALPTDPTDYHVVMGAR